MAAPAQQDNATPPAEVVGQAFATQYYTILHQSPTLVHRFYQDISKLGRTDGDGTMSLTTSMDDINSKIQSYGTLKAEIKSVDAQESYNGGVILLITGNMIKEDESRQRFIQTFFLAPQDKGYFVLNDIFRFVDDVHEHNGNEEVANVEAVPDAPDEVPNGLADQPDEVNEGEVYDPSEDGEGSVVEQEQPVAEVVDEIPTEPKKVVEPEPKIEEAPKKSYASIVKVMRENAAAAPAPTPLKSVPKTQPPVVKPIVPQTAATENTNPNSNVGEDGNDQDVEGDGYSVYVRNLPLNATPIMVEEVFKKFGPIKSNGIQVRNNKGFVFGFVEFETPAAAQSAIEASPILIAGKQVGVEEKKSTTSRVPGNRGRYPPGRGGGGFRNEGPRGRGNFGVRGFGRGDSGRSDYGNRGNGRGGYQNLYNDGYQKGNNMDNGGGRGVRAPGNNDVNIAAKTQRVSASA